VPGGPWTRLGLAALLGGRLEGPDGPAVRLRDPGEANGEDVVLARDGRFLDLCLASPAGLIVLGELTAAVTPPRALLRVPDPEAAWVALLEAFAPDPGQPGGVDESARVHPEAVLEPGVSVGPLAVVGRGARIGMGSRVMAGAFVGEGTTLGANCTIHPNASVLERVTLGDRVIIQAGAVIGNEGFGYRRLPGGGYARLRHIGTVVLEDDVQIGANSVVARGTVGETRIGAGTKIDHGCLVAHNCRVGARVIMAGGSHLAGSSVVEDDVIMLGQVGVADHVRIGARAVLVARAGVSKDLEADGTYRGSPARPIREALRTEAHVRNLERTVARLGELEAEVRRLQTMLEPSP